MTDPIKEINYIEDIVDALKIGDYPKVSRMQMEEFNDQYWLVKSFEHVFHDTIRKLGWGTEIQSIKKHASVNRFGGEEFTMLYMDNPDVLCKETTIISGEGVIQSIIKISNLESVVANNAVFDDDWIYIGKPDDHITYVSTVRRIRSAVSLYFKKELVIDDELKMRLNQE